MQYSAGDYIARKAYCASTAACCPSKVFVDVSCSPNVTVDPVINIDVSCDPQVDVSLNQTVTLDVSFSPIIDLSYNQTLQIDVSFNPTIDVSCNAQVDVSFNPAYTIDISFSPTIVYDVSAVAVTSTVVANPDAFGRARVSNPYTLFEFTSILGKGQSAQGPDVMDEDISGPNSVSAWDPQSYVTMDISGAGYVVRQSHKYIPYQPGKSKLVYMTGVMYHNPFTNPGYTTTGLISRIGHFDASMGVYFECSGGTMAVALRNNGTTEYATQLLWDDPLDGTGVCPVAVDFTKAQIYVFDFEWLGVGQVRCGIVQGGQLYYCHAFTHINTLDAPYTRTAKLPLRYEIRGTAATKNSMHMICGTIISEGGFSPMTHTFHYPVAASTAADLLGLNIDFPSGTGEFAPFISLRVRDLYPQRYGTIKIKNVDFFSASSTKFGAWQVLLNTDISNGSNTWITYDSSASIAEYAVHTNAARVSGGKVIASGFYGSRANATLIQTIEDLLNAPAVCFRNLPDGQSDIVTITANSLSSGSNPVYLSLEWIEIM